MITEKFNIAAYTRISVDTEAGMDNTSIENQKAIIEDFVKQNFPASTLDFFEDRDQSGYTFDERETYPKLRKLLLTSQYDILIIKDFSRFSRRNGLGLVELENLRDSGIRIISIGDSVDYPTYDDWMKIQIHFFVNEMPVTETSKKVRNVVKSRQKEGKWICAVPFGYVITDTKKMEFEMDEPSAEVVRSVFELYNKGWGYKKIANHLTELKIPTPRTAEKARKDAEGIENNIKAKPEWSIVTIQGILDNDFYIGTLRQRKFTRKKINGEDKKLDSDEHIVFENNHEPIIDYRVWAIAQEERKKRSVANYRGVKIYENAYSGYLYCGDCGSPMFSMSRGDLSPAYRCGTYHQRGLKGCTSHHTRVDLLDKLLKSYIQKVKENSQDMLVKLKEAIKKEKKDTKEDTNLINKLQMMIADAHQELKITKRQKIREIMRKPSNEEMIEETYAELEQELLNKIEGYENQMALSADKKNLVVKTNRVAKTVLEIFDDILAKPTLDKNDIGLIIEKIIVYDDRLEIKLKSDIDALLSAEEKQAINFNKPTRRTDAKSKGSNVTLVSVISNGDPLEIFTDRDGEVILKKYSPIGELGNFASQYAESLAKTSGLATLITDKDSVIAVSGVPKRELNKPVSPDLEKIMREKTAVIFNPGDNTSVTVVDGEEKYKASVVCPIISEGDSIGSVVFIAGETTDTVGEVEEKLAQSAAGFLGRQIEE